ncbi:hypothetical protein [Croceicoccus sp. BE223]|uniref:hypothetical protein n=1 Tax=Croceicoccus sp. BE223 TaxID=2817716 RepID=UPI00285ADE5B|nr:hypothetical protein [Croceicoccus sp. BE223]MDR7102036.1 hypothetical protein [Croceicoccus sp. BE223]
MALFKAVIGWIARHVVLWILLIGAILVFNAWRTGADRDARADRLEQVLAQVEQERRAGESALREAEADARGRSVEALQAMLARAEAERDRLVAQRRPDIRRKTSIATMDTELVLADQALELRIAVAERKVAGLERSIAATRAQLDSAAMIAASQKAWVEADRRWKVARAACNAAEQAVDRYETRGRIGRWFGDLTGEGDRLRLDRDHKCLVVDDLETRATAIRDIWDQARRGGAQAARAGQWPRDRLEAGDAMIREAIAADRAGAANSPRGFVQRKWREWSMADILWQAFVALLLIVAMPYLLRLLFWFVLAPIAERRPAIRIAVPGGVAAPMPPAERSRTSVNVRLNAGEELLVRQDYLQSTMASGSKDTRWLLDFGHPLSSLASGLYFLTRVRGAGTDTTISAVVDPFAEVTEVTLPQGGAAVLHPRALAAVVQREGNPLRITSHWRLGSLNAWLTLQLRYFVFHGPSRLIVKGGRGIRVEPAGPGRVFGQDQLAGFSADLAYAVTRTETFWPYFLGRESLLKDRVLGGEGMLLVEEAPMAGRRGGVRHGLEGAADAVLKAVGL